MVHTRRKKGESFEAFLRRHNQKVVKSRFLQLFRNNRFLSPKENKAKGKKKALFGRKLKSNREYLKKIGKWKEEVRGSYRKR